MDHSNSPSVFLSLLAFLSPVFSSQLFPEWKFWHLPSQRSQNPLVSQHRRHEDPSRGHDNFPREFPRVSRESVSERYFQYLNVPSKKVNQIFSQTNPYIDLFSRNTSLDGTEETRYTLHQDLNKERITDSEQG